MKKDRLDQVWNSQNEPARLEDPKSIIAKVDRQRKGQITSITIMTLTIGILTWYALSYTGMVWNNFSLGLVLMVSSLAFRVLLELISMYRKENRLITLDASAFQGYLKRHHSLRQYVNFYITPICFGVYCYGFSKLLPYFKQEFSTGFYHYLLISGVVSIAVIALIVARSIMREHRNLKELDTK